MSSRLVAALIACAVAVLGGGSVHAQGASLRVSPVTLELPAGKKAATLTLGTDLPEVSVQVRAFRWRQPDGVDQLDRAESVVVSPPAVVLKRGVEQVVRIVRPAGEPPAAEESYRILVDELPDPRRRAEGAVAFVMRQSLPVFFLPRTPAKAELAWRLEPGADGALQLVGVNTGGRRVRLTEMQLADDAGKRVERWPGLAGYILAGATMRWPLKAAGAPVGRLTLTATSDGGPIRVTVSPPPAS